MSERKSIKDRIRHAFAIEDAADFEPTEREAAAAEKVCREVVRRRMTVPAVMLLEMSRPLNYLGAQALHFFQPFGTVLIEPGSWETFANFLERRGSSSTWLASSRTSRPSGWTPRRRMPPRRRTSRRPPEGRPRARRRPRTIPTPSIRRRITTESTERGLIGYLPQNPEEAPEAIGSLAFPPDPAPRRSRTTHARRP